jgi:hypothetical protein
MIKKGFVETSIEILDKPSSLYGVCINLIVHYSNFTPKTVTVEDKTASEQVRLIAQLNDKDKSTVMNIIDTMLTKQKFQTFFKQNIQTAKKIKLCLPYIHNILKMPMAIDLW